MLGRVMDAGALPSRRGRAPSHRRSGTWFIWLTLGVAWLTLAYVAAAVLLLATFGAKRLHDTLGESFYNSWVATSGTVQALTVIALLVVFDVVVGVVYALSRLLRSRTWRLAGALVIAALVIGSVRVGIVSIDRPDPLRDQVFSLIVPMDTEYAPGYSTAAFRAVHLGMSEEQVLALLGPPLREPRWDNHHYAFYSISPSDGNYWQRILGYDEQGRVAGITVGLWID